MKKLKRPLAFAGMILFFALAVVYAFGITYAVVAVVFSGLASSAKFYVKNKNEAVIYALAAVTAAAGIGIYAFSAVQDRTVLDSYAGRTATINATVTDFRDMGETTIVTAMVTRVEGEKTASFETSFFLEDYVNIGDEITARVTFDTERDPYKKELAIKCKLEETLGLSQGKNKYLAWSAAARSYLAHSIKARLTAEEGDIAAAVITGDKSYLPPNLLQAFSRAGISHILVISGLHITLIIGLFYGMAMRLGLNRYLGMGLLLCVISGCLLLYGAKPSVVRACVMCLLVYSSRIVVRRSDPPTSLGFAAIILIIFDPKCVTDVSFLLSFGCCFAITVVYPYVEAAVKQKINGASFFTAALRRVINAVMLTVIINIVTFPILIIFGIPVSLVAPLTNICTIWLVTILMIAALIMCIPVGIISGVFGMFAGITSRAVIAITRFFASFSLASVQTGAPYLKIWLVFCAVIIAVCVIYKKYKIRARFAAACMILVLLTGILSRLAFTVAKPVVTLYRDNAVIVQENGRALVVIDDIDHDGVGYLLSYLKYRYVDDVAYVIITKDIGAPAELYLKECLPDAVFAASYLTDTPGFLTREPVKYLQKIENFSVLVHEDGRIEIGVYNSVLICVARYDSDITYVGFDLVALRMEEKRRETFYLIDGAVYAADSNLLLYIGDDGSIKTVVE